MISILPVSQIMYLDFFLCGTIRHKWIVAQRLLAAFTIPEEKSRLQKNYHFSSAFFIDHTSMLLHKRKSLKNIPSRHENGVKHCITSTNSNSEAFRCNPADGSFATLASSARSIYQLSERSVPLVLTSITFATPSPSVVQN